MPGIEPEPTLELRLLGELTVYRGAAPVRLPQSKKTRALLAYLVLTGRPQRRARLCSLLWDVAADPRSALRWSLSKLRPLINDAEITRIVTEGDTVAFEPGGAVVDVVRTRRALARGVAALSVDELRGIAGAHRGELLEGLELSDFDEFSAWCLAERERARAERARVLRALVHRLRSQPEEALPYAQALVEIEPVDEGVRAMLVGLLADAGRAAEARQQCEAGERQLRELGVEPTGALAAAWSAVQTERRASPAGIPPGLPAVEPGLVAESPLVGRGAERVRLEGVLDAVTGGRARVAVISGEPGVGKTRLLVELLEQVRECGGTVLEGRAFEAERGRPYGAWIDALRPLTARVDEVGLREPLAPLLPGGGPSGEQTRAQMIAAVVELLAAQAAIAAPIALALDDVQWLDEASAELLHYAARKLRDHPVLLALTARGGEIVDNDEVRTVLQSLRRERLLDELEVGPLGRADTEALVAACAPNADAARVFEQCGGNPLFALELARSGPWTEGRLPATLSEVVRDRVERLSPEAAEVLRWVSVFGPSVAVRRLSRATALDDDALIAALELLERHALLRADGDGYAFPHDVVRRAIYDELSLPRRRLMHKKIAEDLHREGATDETSAADIAHHANLAGDAAMAARACVTAGRRSLTLFATRDALALARRGARYVAMLPEPERTTVAIELWDIELAARTPADPETVGRELEELAERAIDAGRLEHARLGFHLLGYLRWDVGRSVDAARHMLHAEALSRSGERGDRAEALAEAARCLALLDRDLGHAEALALEARALASQLGIEVAAVPDALGLLRHHRGELDAAAAAFSESRTLAHRVRDRHGEFIALEHLVMLELQRGRAREAHALSEDLAALGARLREGSEGPCARALAAVSAYAAGVGGARDQFVEAVSDLRVADAKQRLGFALLMAASLDLDRGEPEAARQLAEEALALVTLLKLRSHTIWARALLARAARAVGDEGTVDEQLAALRKERQDGVAAWARTAAGDVLDPSRCH